MKVSYNEATAMHCSTLAEDLILCEEAGFDYIEIRGDMLLDYLCEHSVKELINFFKNSRLRPHAMNALYTYRDMFHPTRADVERDRRLMAYFLACCRVAEQIGDHYFISLPEYIDDANDIFMPHDPLTTPFPDPPEKVMDDSVRILRRLSDIAGDFGINVSWECVGGLGCAVRSAAHAWEIVQAVDRDNVGITIDSFNLFLNGQTNDYSDIEKIPADKLYTVHVNNCDIVDNGAIDHSNRKFVDGGAIDIKGYLTAVKKTGYDGMVSIETFRDEYWKMSPRDVIFEAYRTTKELVDSISQ